MPPLALCFPMFCRIVRKRVCMVFLFIAVCAVLAIGLFLFLLHGFGAIKLVCLKKHLKCAFLTKKRGQAPSSPGAADAATSSEKVQAAEETDEEDTAAIAAPPDVVACGTLAVPLHTKQEKIGLILSFLFLATAVSIFLYYYVFSPERYVGEYLNYVKLCLVFVITAVAALVDFKTKTIPNRLVLFGLLCRLPIYIAEVATGQPMKDILINDAIGVGIGFGILFFAALLSRGAVGFGDAKLFAVIGIHTGYICTFGTLFFSLLVSAVAGIILLIKYRDKKRAFPFAPFIFVGYTAVLMLGLF